MVYWEIIDSTVISGFLLNSTVTLRTRSSTVEYLIAGQKMRIRFPPGAHRRVGRVWFIAPVLKTGGRKVRGFESYTLLWKVDRVVYGDVLLRR
jgi:hypothetical protein